MRLDDFAGRDFAVRGFVEVALIKADLPEGGFAEIPILPKETDFVGKVRSDREWRWGFGIEGWCIELQNSNTRRETAAKRDEVGRGSRLYGADIAKE